MTPASTFFISAIAILVSYFSRKYRVEDLDTFTSEQNAIETFEFIVVGGGTAGCVVARRLAEAKFKVLLLEAGGTPPPMTNVPLASLSFDGILQPVNTYFYQSTPQKYLQIGRNGIVSTFAGKMLGGSSSHNGMNYLRGSPYVYDGWAEATGDDSWRYSNILKFFKKFEDYRGNYSDQHGTAGPVTTSSPYFSASDVWLQAGKELGYDILASSVSQGVGFSPSSAFVKDGFRVSSYSAYIKPVEESLKKYLTIRRYSPVSKVTFRRKRAEGVLYERHGIKMKAMATKEIILCAGTYISPILLIKSGIGPKDEIKKAKVKPIQNLPQVGKNLQDHVEVEIGPFHIRDKKDRWSFLGDLTYNELEDVLFRGTGKIGYPSNTFAFFTSKRGQKINSQLPDIELQYQYQTYDFNDNSCYVAMVQPRSIGYLQINSSATGMLDDHLPILHYRYLTDRSDLEVILEGIDYCFKIMENTTAFRNIGTSFTTKPLEACKGFPFRTKSYWRCFVEHEAYGDFHASGTNRMGKNGDYRKSVVDSKLNVHGVKNLRVIDASIMPKITNANTCGPTYLIAEKGVAGILEKYLKKDKTL